MITEFCEAVCYSPKSICDDMISIATKVKGICLDSGSINLFFLKQRLDLINRVNISVRLRNSLVLEQEKMIDRTNVLT